MSSRAGLGPDGKVYCKHMEEAAKRKSNTPKHPNREFYCCKRYQGDPARCNFWCWADHLLPGESMHDSSSSSHPLSKEAPSPSAPPTSTSTPYTRQPRRHRSQSNSPSEAVTPRSRKRLEDIEVGLKQREHDLSPTRYPCSSKEPGHCAPSSIIPTIPQPPSPVPTEVDLGEAEAQPRKTYSFLGLHYSPESVASAIKDEGQPLTPKKRRLTPQPATNAILPGDGLLLTPPQSTRRIAEFDQPGPLSAMTRSKKGKERESAQPVQIRSQDGSNSGEAQIEDSLPLFTLPEDSSTISSVSPTTAENVLDYTDGMRTRVKALSEYMDSFDITQAAKLLQIVERQKIQYEYRDRSQKKRIEELVAERDKLAAEVSRLKETLQRHEGNALKDDGHKM